MMSIYSSIEYVQDSMKTGLWSTKHSCYKLKYLSVEMYVYMYHQEFDKSSSSIDKIPSCNGKNNDDDNDNNIIMNQTPQIFLSG